MKADPLVSVIMPVYNGQDFVGSAIKSVLDQSYTNLELLVINDGSTDRTEGIILDLLEQDPRVRYFRQENRGVSSARNAGLQHMQGGFFCFLDADDNFTPHSIAARMAKFSADPQLWYCDGPVIVCDENMKPERRWVPEIEGFVFNKLIRLAESCFFGPTWFIRRDPAVTYAFQEKMTHAEDLFFFIEISRLGKYGFVEENVLYYRSGQSSAMKNLKGLANGYLSLYANVVSRFGDDVTVIDRIWLWLKIRKIMTLSFLADGNFVDAFYFLMMGKVR